MRYESPGESPLSPFFFSSSSSSSSPSFSWLFQLCHHTLIVSRTTNVSRNDFTALALPGSDCNVTFPGPFGPLYPRQSFRMPIQSECDIRSQLIVQCRYTCFHSINYFLYSSLVLLHLFISMFSCYSSSFNTHFNSLVSVLLVLSHSYVSLHAPLDFMIYR